MDMNSIYVCFNFRSMSVCSDNPEEYDKMYESKELLEQYESYPNWLKGNIQYCIDKDNIKNSYLEKYKKAEPLLKKIEGYIIIEEDLFTPENDIESLEQTIPTAEKELNDAKEKIHYQDNVTAVEENAPYKQIVNAMDTLSNKDEIKSTLKSSNPRILRLVKSTE